MAGCSSVLLIWLLYQLKGKWNSKTLIVAETSVRVVSSPLRSAIALKSAHNPTKEHSWLVILCTSTQWFNFLLCTMLVQFNQSFCTTKLPTLRYSQFFQEGQAYPGAKRLKKDNFISISLLELSFKGMFTPWLTIINPNRLITALLFIYKM